MGLPSGFCELLCLLPRVGRKEISRSGDISGGKVPGEAPPCLGESGPNEDFEGVNAVVDGETETVMGGVEVVLAGGEAGGNVPGKEGSNDSESESAAVLGTAAAFLGLSFSF